MSDHEEIDAAAAKETITEYCKRHGALAVGVANVEAVERICPQGHRPSDIMPRVRSVVSLGVGGQSRGAWSVPAKAMGYFGSTENRAYSIAYGLAFFIERKAGHRERNAVDADEKNHQEQARDSGALTPVGSRAGGFECAETRGIERIHRE